MLSAIEVHIAYFKAKYPEISNEIYCGIMRGISEKKAMITFSKPITDPAFEEELRYDVDILLTGLGYVDRNRFTGVMDGKRYLWHVDGSVEPKQLIGIEIFFLSFHKHE